ncbi:UNVERIFIED_CONTAM: hypothetical protein GTU68_031568 [Idotea baltica]|nr:hypothetical protein [Idotea baltica]
MSSPGLMRWALCWVPGSRRVWNSDSCRSARLESCASILARSVFQTTQAAHRTWKCASLPLRRTRGFCWSINGLKLEAQWTAQFVWSSNRTAKSPALPRLQSKPMRALSPIEKTIHVCPQ